MRVAGPDARGDPSERRRGIIARLMSAIAHASEPRAQVRPVGSIIVLSLGALDFGLEASIVLPALPALAEHYGASLVGVGWFATAFQLVAVAAVPLLGRLGDANRFRDLAAVRNYTGLVPKVDQSGLSDKRPGPTKAGDHLLRQALFLAADHARKIDPTLAARYQRLRAAGRHHNSALCTLGAVLVTRIAACWRADQPYQLRDLDGRPITEAEGRALCATLKPPVTGTGRRSKESHSAPSTGPSSIKARSDRKTA